jgi:hypothetical protein
MGYEDINDHEALRYDLIFALAVGKVINSETGVDYVFGLAQNSRLLQLSQSIQYRASQEYSQKIQTVVEFFETLLAPSPDLEKQATAFVDNSVWYSSLDYKTKDSWSRSRRVVSIFILFFTKGIIN